MKFHEAALVRHLSDTTLQATYCFFYLCFFVRHLSDTWEPRYSATKWCVGVGFSGTRQGKRKNLFSSRSAKVC